jgi:ABC-type multidrug transport system fused ATPase/permease subunit
MYAIKLYFDFIKENIYLFILFIISILLSYPLEAVVLPQIYSRFFTTIKKGTDKKIFIKYFIYIISVLTIIYLSYILMGYVEIKFLPKMNEYIINFLYKNILLKNKNNYTEIEFGKLISRTNLLPTTLRDFNNLLFIWVCPKVVTIIIIICYFFYVNYKLGLVSIIFFIIIFSYNFYNYNKCINTSSIRYKYFEKQAENIHDKLSNIFSIYSAGTVDKELDSFYKNTDIYIDKFEDNLKCINYNKIVNIIFLLLSFIFLNFTVIYIYYKKEISLHLLIATLLTITYYIPSFYTITSTLRELIHTLGVFREIDPFIKDIYLYDKENKKNEKEKKENNITDNNIIIKNGNINIKNLSFGYGNNMVIKNISLNIKAGEKIAITGSSGNGKSTLIKLLMGYYKVDNNMILIDDIDVNKYELNNLRTQISYVNQNTKLFNSTIIENIKYGTQMTDKDVIQIINDIGINDLYSNLDNGFNSKVGVGGDKLSGGQRQMIHILRCFGKNNKIMILDEPTTSIDVYTKSLIMKAIKKLSKNCTLIIITHDKELLKLVERVVVIKTGEIIEDTFFLEKRTAKRF